MRKLTTVAVLAASAAASGCASMGLSAATNDAQSPSWGQIRVSHNAILVADQPAPAPPGLLAFCMRAGGDCDTFANAEPATSAPDTGGARFLPAAWDGSNGQTPAHSLSNRQYASGLFQRMLAARAEGAGFHYARHQFLLTQARWAQLVSVNRDVNHAIAGASDIQQYGVSEYWAMPLSEPATEHGQRLTPRGDCEDYALEKRARLISLGWSSDALALAVTQAPGAEAHAVLVVQTDRGDFILDNLDDAPRNPGARAYHWIARQADVSLSDWASAHIQLAAASPPPEVLLQADLLGRDEGDNRPRSERVALLDASIDPAS